ncbi:MAG: nucleotide-binding universal stress UspA family protein [Flavobacteriales bacterium]|jgi:nucleotide-binding universal stress UspA family protein
MKIAVLVDLTPLCISAVKMGSAIAEISNADLVLIHISDFGSDEQKVNEEMEKLLSTVPSGVSVVQHVEKGAFFSLIPTVISDIGADLALVPTHGKVGLMQNLFGANILKLVKTIPIPTLVIQDGSIIPENGFSNILFPVGPHDDFHIKYEQTGRFAKMFGTKVIIYTVRNDVRGISEKMRINISESKNHFEKQGISFDEVSEEPSVFSVGYARHILQYPKSSDTDVICIMANVSDDNGYIGKSDKENMLLNEHRVPVLCANL